MLKLISFILVAGLIAGCCGCSTTPAARPVVVVPPAPAANAAAPASGGTVAATDMAETLPASEPAAAAAVPAANMSAPVVCDLPAPDGQPDSWQKSIIEMAPEGAWFHRVFNERLFRAPDWGGADSWFLSLNLGPNGGGYWTDMGNPGQIVYRGESTELSWCLGVATDATWKDQMLQGFAGSAAINVRISPNTPVAVKTASGNVIVQNTSDMGDITIVLPDSGVVTIAVDYSTAAPTHESLVWWGPYDRADGINTIDAR